MKQNMKVSGTVSFWMKILLVEETAQQLFVNVFFRSTHTLLLHWNASKYGPTE